MSDVIDLTQAKCEACEGLTHPLSENQIQNLLPQVNEWLVINDATAIRRAYRFKDFYQTMAFVNAIAWIANQENHHPDLEVGYNYCNVVFTTHAIQGLSHNDFICAAKIDKLLL